MAVKSMLARRVPWILERVDLDELFDYWQERGFHVTPNHFYQPVPDTRRIGEEQWCTPLDMPGIEMRDESQLALARDVFARYRDEWNFPRTKTETEHDFYFDNGFFESFDVQVLHSLIRHFKPSRIIEIGSGFSTFVAARACRMNGELERVESELIAVEPYPGSVLKRGFAGLTELIEKPLELVGIQLAERLGEGDILFVDSSHVAKIGSDVNYLFHQVLPRLSRGVLVHLHDIFLPAEYPRQWIFKDHKFFNEQYMLQAFLCFNSAFEVFWASHYLYLKHGTTMKELFRYQDLGAIGPGSFWLRRK